MRKLLLLFILLMPTAFGLQAQTRLVGYTSDDSISVRGGAFGQAGTYTIGALATPQMLSPYEGCRILGLRVAAALPLGRTRTFIYRADGNSLTPVVEQRQRLYEGWNTVLFNGDGYIISGNETLFFGFDYEETAEMVNNDEGALCGVGDEVDGGFYAYGNFGSGQGLYQLTGIGRLCVQLIVDVSQLPQYDLDLKELLHGFKYKKAGENIDALCTFTNVGLNAIDNYQLGYQIDDGPAVLNDFSEPLAEGREEAWQFSFTLPADLAVGMHRLSVFVSTVQGEPLHERSKNDTLTASFAIYEQSMQRDKVYFEIYTDQTSPYVPYLDEAVKELKRGASADMTAIVNVHRPGTPLAIGEGGYLHELYAYTWPTFTINRAYFPGEPHVAYDVNDYLPLLSASMTAGIIGDMIVQDYASPSFADLRLQADYSPSDRTLSVTATGRLLPEAQAIYGDLALTLMLTEDSVTSQQSVYNATSQFATNVADYRHDDVLRAYMTPPTGATLHTAGDTYTGSFTTTLDAAWNPARMRLTALLTKAASSVSEQNLPDVDVINAATLRLDQLPGVLGIAAAPVVTERPEALFTLDGKPVSPGQLQRGIYVKRTADGTTRKVAVK